jgi:hypothetical protein
MVEFRKAIEAAKANRVARAGWNGAGMFAYIVPASQYPITGLQRILGEGNFTYRAYWAKKLLKKT